MLPNQVIRFSIINSKTKMTLYSPCSDVNIFRDTQNHLNGIFAKNICLASKSDETVRQILIEIRFTRQIT